MSQITLVQTSQPDKKSSLVGSDAKNALPAKTTSMISCTDVIGLSWIFLEDPLNIQITDKLDDMECVRI